MATAKKEELKTATVLAFESKLANSDALLMSGLWEEIDKPELWQPVKIKDQYARGTISNRLPNELFEDPDPTKLIQEIEKPRPLQYDKANLPIDTDTLKVSFTLRVIGNLTNPSTCNNPDYQKALSTAINNYIETNQFNELSRRYALNLANGRFLWRNRVCAEAVEVHIKLSGEAEPLIFNAYNFDLKDFSVLKDKEDESKIKKLADIINNGLKGSDDTFSFIEVDAYVKLGKGQMVYPSQEMVMGGGKGDKSKFLYQLNDTAAMHSQKIGNAIRTIDTWHPEANEVGAIAIEPYGSVTNRGKAYRTPSNKLDFYTLLDNWILKDKQPDLEQQHYTVAVLIRGGVFGEGKEKES